VYTSFKTDPDEKGTERTSLPYIQSRVILVSRLIPMKRELKAILIWLTTLKIFRFKTDPDEKGTERLS